MEENSEVQRWGCLLTALFSYVQIFIKNHNYIQHLLWRERRDLWTWK